MTERLTITLRFLATGDSYTSCSTISRIAPEVCDAISEVLKDWVKIPTSEKEWLEIAEEFQEKWVFPYAIAAMDGKYVMIQAPGNSGTEYHNYKHFSSIVLFALVDADYCFKYVNIGSQGKLSDWGIFKHTSLYKRLEEKSMKIPQPSILQIPYTLKFPYVILADKAFALNEYTKSQRGGL